MSSNRSYWWKPQLGTMNWSVNGPPVENVPVAVLISDWGNTRPGAAFVYAASVTVTFVQPGAIENVAVTCRPPETNASVTDADVTQFVMVGSGAAEPFPANAMTPTVAAAATARRCRNFIPLPPFSPLRGNPRAAHSFGKREGKTSEPFGVSSSMTSARAGARGRSRSPASASTAGRGHV